jgi:uncharacterized protein
MNERTDQADVVRFLSDPGSHGGAAVERIDTHASIVFLAGTQAFKLKRAVKYDYLDFSTLELRKRFCEAEMRVNSRMAPALYRRVVPVVRSSTGALALDGEGAPVDWVIEMNRFDQDALFDRMAARGCLDLALMAPLAEEIASFHDACEPRPEFGGEAGMARVIQGNAAGFRDFGGGTLDDAASESLTRAAVESLRSGSRLLESRRKAGFVRECHGDLHLGNIVLFAGRPTLFDAIEFNDDIACVDVMYDLAFLLMDLWHRGLPRHANAILNSYLAETQDLDGLAALPLFLSCRAAIRAKTTATAARLQQEPALQGRMQVRAREYLDLAIRLLRPPPPAIVAIGGLSGSGKSTVARALAPSLGAAPGAVILRSDEIRKRLCHTAPLTKLDRAGYTPEVSARVYEALAAGASVIGATGHSVIVDAVFARAEDRAAIERAARSCGLPFAALWLDAPERTLIERVTQRASDVSDADADVVRMQYAQWSGDAPWLRVDAGADEATVAARAHRRLRSQLIERAA